MKNKRKDYIIIVLVIAVVLMSVGFAITSYTQLLEINGSNIEIKSASWNVHFDSTSYSETTGSVTGTHSLNNTLFTYNVSLSPNEFYSAEFDVKNDGTFDAMLESITLTPALSSAEQEYLNYYIQYDGQMYSASQLFNNGPVIAAGSTKHIKVYINYFTNETNASSLPVEDKVLNLVVALNYKQV